MYPMFFALFSYFNLWKKPQKRSAVNNLNVFWQGDNAKREDMEKAREKLKEFNAKRKLKGGMIGVMAVAGLKKWI